MAIFLFFSIATINNQKCSSLYSYRFLSIKEKPPVFCPLGNIVLVIMVVVVIIIIYEIDKNEHAEPKVRMNNFIQNTNLSKKKLNEFKLFLLRKNMTFCFILSHH